MERIPEEGPVLLVGNHSGGNITPDTIVFTLAFNTYFGVERPFYQLAHNLVLTSPDRSLPAPLRDRRGLARERAQGARLRRGGAGLPGRRLGGEPARPGRRTGSTSPAARDSSSWRSTPACRSSRWSRSGGQETAIFLSHGDRLAKLLRLDKLLRLKTLPVNLSLPWIVNVGDFLGHLPLPAKITVQVMEPIDLRERYGRDSGLDRIYEDVTALMQDQLTELAAERRLPVIGWDPRVRIEQKVTVDAPRHLVWEYVTEPANYPVFMDGLTRWDVAGERHKGLGARYRMLIRVGAADVGGLIEIVEWQPAAATWPGARSPGVDQRGRWSLRELGDGRTRVTFRFAYGVAGGGDHRPDRRAGRRALAEPPLPPVARST